jgi:DNA-binding winged helix-turn-helix (wHTH) protein/tetratricopeptide (TPR) repeat protein
MADIVFGPFTLDIPGGRLLRNGEAVRMRPQAFRVLSVLFRHQGETVDYDRMIAEAWGGTLVSRHTVDVTIGEVRRGLGELGRWITNRPKLGYSLSIPASDELVRLGWHFADRRTREGFEHAIDCFQRAASSCPADARAFEGLSAAYLGLATFGMYAPREVYPKFLESHERAVSLGGLKPELRSDRAHGLHLFERRYPEAEAELLASLREKPTLAKSYVRLAMLHATLGRLDDALEIVRRGYEVAPLLPLLPPMEMLLRLWRREFEETIAIGARTVEHHPHLQVGRAIYAQALEFSGHLTGALEQYRRASVTSPDLPWLRALEGACLAKMGRVDQAAALLEELEWRRHAEYIDAYFMAVFREALGQRDSAFEELRRACEENSRWLYSLDIDPKMDPFRGDPRFARLRASLVAGPDRP